MIIDYQRVAIGSSIQSASFSLSKGEFCMLVGQDTIATSQLIASIYGAIAIRGAQATVLGHSMLDISGDDLATLRKDIGIVLADHVLPTDLTVNQVMNAVLKAQNKQDEINQQISIDELLDLLGLLPQAEQLVSALSPELKQLLCIGAALIKKPKLLVADQPTINLNEGKLELVMKIIYDYASMLQMTTLMATHDLQLLQAYPSRILTIVDRTLSDYP